MNGSEHAPEHPAAVEAATAVLAAHVSHCGSGGNLWQAKCLGCDWRDEGRGTMLHALNAHRTHVAEALAAAGLLADRRDLPVGVADLREKFENTLRWHLNVVAEEGKGSPYISLAVINASNDLDRILALATGTGTQGGGGL